MTPLILQSTSLLGALLILIAFAGAQTGRMNPRRLPSALLNLVGSSLVFASALYPPNAGVLLLEGAWAVISLGTVIQARKRPLDPEATP